MLKEGGASCCNYLVTITTHVLCGDGFDENEIAQAADLYEIPSVTEAWVVASARLGRLASLKPYDPTPNSKCFSQVFASITQVTAADRYRLYALITFNGGVVERNLTSKTTHLICGRADGPAYARAVTIKNDNFSVVTPDWIIDSLNGKGTRLTSNNFFQTKILYRCHFVKYLEICKKLRSENVYGPTGDHGWRRLTNREWVDLNRLGGLSSIWSTIKE